MEIATKILLVDDEIKILNSLKRHLRKQFDIVTALSGPEALEMLRDKDDYAVIVSDMNMPIMNGTEFLAEARKIRPDTIRVMLTGNADQQTPIDAVNKGDIFRFHTKPCHTDVLEQTLKDAIQQYQLIMAEKELLEGTLLGSIEVMAELLSMINPEAYGRTSRIKHHVLEIGRELGVKNLWQLDVMASLSLIGCILLPDEVNKKISLGQPLNEQEQILFNQHPDVAAKLIAHIPRLGTISNAIKYQEKLFNGGGVPDDNVAGKDIPAGARILKIVIDFDRFMTSGMTKSSASTKLKEQASHYDKNILAAFINCLQKDHVGQEQDIHILALKEDMFLAQDLYSKDKRLILCKGQETTMPICNKLSTLLKNGAIFDTISVIVKEESEQSAETEQQAV